MGLSRYWISCKEKNWKHAMSPAPLQEHRTSGPPSCKLSFLLFWQLSFLSSFSLNSLMFFLLPLLKPMNIKTHHTPKHIWAQINKYSIDCQLSSFRFHQKYGTRVAPNMYRLSSTQFQISPKNTHKRASQICYKFPGAQFQILPKNTQLYFQNICMRLSTNQFQILSKKQ